MNKYKIYRKFLQSKMKLINRKSLIDYVTLCSNNNVANYGTVHSHKGYHRHHVLPSSVFPEVSKLHLHKWNEVYLAYADHFKAHKLLAEAYTKNYSILSALAYMSDTFVVRGFLPKDAIAPEEYATIWENLSKIKSVRFKGSGNSRAKYIVIYDNNDNIMHKCHGNFKEVCVANGLPVSTLRTSHKTNTKLYMTYQGSKTAKANGKLHLKGWYAKVTDEKWEPLEPGFNLEKDNNQSGKNNPIAVHIDIYNSSDVLVCTSIGTLRADCARLGVSFQAIGRSYHQGAKLYDNPRSLAKARQHGLEVYAGWYAIKR